MRWIIGDIHGMLRPLTALLDAVRKEDPVARFYFAGDYINRGPDSRGVIDLLLSLDNARCIRGNHDDIFDELINGTCYSLVNEDPVRIFTWFLRHGLSETLESYGADYAELEYLTDQATPPAVDKLRELVPESHRRFFRSLPACIEDVDLFVIHAMWSPDEPDDPAARTQRLLSEQSLRYRVLWGRYSRDLITRRKRWERTGYFGHTPVSNYASPLKRFENVPIVGKKMVLLDTAAALGRDGRLTAFCPDDGTFIQSDRAGAILPRRPGGDL